jgi:hypothetical protein
MPTPTPKGSSARSNSIKEECLNRLIPLGERHHRRAIVDFVGHYHRERIIKVWPTN